jgi:hypothetical protein
LPFLFEKTMALFTGAAIMNPFCSKNQNRLRNLSNLLGLIQKKNGRHLQTLCPRYVCCL